MATLIDAKAAFLRRLPPHAVIIRAIHERGENQVIALAELRRRGLWLAPEQREQAGLPKEEVDHVP